MGKSAVLVYELLALALTGILTITFQVEEWWQMLGIWVITELMLFTLTGARVLLVRFFVRGQ